PDAVVRVCFLEVAFGGFVAAEAVFDAALVERVHGAVAGFDAAAAVDGAELQAVPDPDDGVAADVVDLLELVAPGAGVGRGGDPVAGDGVGRLLAGLERSTGVGELVHLGLERG